MVQTTSFMHAPMLVTPAEARRVDEACGPYGFFWREAAAHRVRRLVTLHAAPVLIALFLIAAFWMR